MSKHLACWQGRARKARSDHRKRSEQGQASAVFVDSFLWIIAAGAPTKLLAKLELEAAPSWPTGVYLFGADVLRVGLVVASELPRDATTLLVRLMAAGPLLAQAIEEVTALPVEAYERAIAEPVLLAFQHMLGQKPSRHPEEEFIVELLKGWEHVRIEMQARAVLTVLRVRGITVPDAARERILAQKDLPCLERWLEKAVTATSLVQVLDDPS